MAWISNGTTDIDVDGCRDIGEDLDDDNDGLIEISNKTDLSRMRYNLAGDSYSFHTYDRGIVKLTSGCPIPAGTEESVCNGYELSHDIDLNLDDDGNSGPSNWTPIGATINGDSADSFSASFDGNKRTIDNLRIKGVTGASTAFFHKVSGTIKNIRFQNIDIEAMDNGSTEYFTAAVAGKLLAGGFLTNIALEDLTITGADTADAVSVLSILEL